MRRPKQSKAQKQYAREQRAILSLRRAWVVYMLALDDDTASDELRADALVMAGAGLEAAAIGYASVLSPRERRRLVMAGAGLEAAAIGYASVLSPRERRRLFK